MRPVGAHFSRPLKTQLCSIEPLEARIAPAAVVTFTDVDGDVVKVTASKGPLDITDLTLSGGASGQLQSLNLTDAGFQGASIAFSVTRVPGGDGLAHVGRINATGRDLGTVTVKGDLAVIDCGDGIGATPALKMLNVFSLGRWGTSTGAPDLTSDIDGRLEVLKVRTDVKGAGIFATDSSATGNGKLGIVMIRGSLIGGSSVASGVIVASDAIGAVNIGGNLEGGSATNAGVIDSAGKIGSVTIGRSLIGGPALQSGLIRATSGIGAVKVAGDIRGGSGDESGKIFTPGNLASLTVGGSVLGAEGHYNTTPTKEGQVYVGGKLGALKLGRDLRGGAGINSGSIHVAGNVGPVSIGGSIIDGQLFGEATMGVVNVRGDIRALGISGGDVIATGNIAGVNVGGSLVGGSGLSPSGTIRSMLDLGPVKIGGDIIGGDGNGGLILAFGKLTSVTVTGSLIGGAGASSGNIGSAGDIGLVKIGRSVIGGDGDESGKIIAFGNLNSLIIGGSVFGGAGDYNTLAPSPGQIFTGGNLGTVRIGGNLEGGDGISSAQIRCFGNLTSVTVGGSVHGGVGALSAVILGSGNSGPLKIGRDLAGGTGDGSGAIRIGGRLTSVTLGGSLIGSAADNSGAIISFGNIGPVKIAGDIAGGNATGGTSVMVSGYVGGVSIASLTVGGSIVAGTHDGLSTLSDSGAVRVDNNLGPVVVKGSLVGNSTQRVVISGRGESVATPTRDLALASLTVGGRVEFTDILAGYDPTGAAVNANAQIGAVSVGGDWIASNLVAGAQRGGDALFGTFDDDQIGGGAAGVNPISRIASIVIKGQALGTPGTGGDNFGFVAEHLVSLTVAGVAIPLTPGPNSGGDFFNLGPSGDLTVRELT